MSDNLLATLFCVAFVGIIYLISGAISAYSCYSKTERTGFASEWGFVQGCLIEIEKGRWVPLENYRQL